eukprot:Gregarina_sp_Poly_1__2296@NODE_1611_length_3717_cov_65_703836_g1062_i0_p2_GENE_NODE_1611_length_3717_cov_65_703836_g1062_i0NODE_1611_length_3717_cov_65_703836_g1062_i0_p2_ORF_typecomplete_len296_score15_46Methyltransf_8/PF05148_15/1_1e49Methyltransf_31/PF13847_6/0_00066MetW/PF07021_12/0_001Ubie_methyltran/PF01209_18/0_017Methyltransf_23/PF13489_6/0_058Methyltransf_11/PF08241_12/0_11_NODE_1611_length_3717_cov_65_703836_g1062_i02021089
MLSLSRKANTKLSKRAHSPRGDSLEGGQFRLINETFYLESSEKTQLRLTKQKDLQWAAKYHTGYAKQMEKWPAHPLDTIIPWIQETVPANSIILDLGSGDCRIWKVLKESYRVISVDFAPPNSELPPTHSHVQKYLDCGGFIKSNIRKISILPNNSVKGCCVFCLSLMGTDWPNFIQEAVRIMQKNSYLAIAEVSSRIDSCSAFVRSLEHYGLLHVKKVCLKDYFTVLFFKIYDGKVSRGTSAKLQLAEGNLLKPCVYNKRRAKDIISTQKKASRGKADDVVKTRKKPKIEIVET